ncbi:endonuclease/exonuclease/phosphatase family protein [Sphingomonas sp. BIUV-7]|uniref:Endonuclease/exonuclease/phosphatase family protein n=1 Tax=Sphingomonas natans TaxID=3063330 RepID=A0ABT8Y406_9SPHN|nr:endonuclease/exonuclease/phosphatase family protein [Sphingomonas sp. BIUV-7]MDO6413049.1 endonuclease/exonuclease/phosphatase family protein [Sphingomonas sp. BIUV-7]
MVTIASYNIRKAIAADRRRRPDRILEVLEEIGADIVVLQEADRRFGSREAAIPFHMLAEHGHYRPVPIARRSASMGWHGNAILIRTGLVEIEGCDALTIPTLEPRGAVRADLRIGGKCLRVVGMHLDLSGLWRRKQAHAILAQVADGGTAPIILCGDLNEWRPRQGCLQDFGVHHENVPLGPTFPVRRPVGRLDRIFIGGGVRVEASGVHSSLTARTASDHLPIWAKLKL